MIVIAGLSGCCYSVCMETIKRYGVKMRDLGGDAALNDPLVAGRTVPKKFMETPGRIWLKRMIRVMGLFCFVLTVLGIVFVFAGMAIPALTKEVVFLPVLGMLGGLFFVNHMGLFMEMAGDSAGKNWFAKGAGLMWFSLFGTFLVAILVRMISSLF